MCNIAAWNSALQITSRPQALSKPLFHVAAAAAICCLNNFTYSNDGAVVFVVALTL